MQSESPSFTLLMKILFYLVEVAVVISNDTIRKRISKCNYFNKIMNIILIKS